MKVIVMTGGGSSGHVTPNIALIPKLKQLEYEIHYVGSKNGIEKKLIEKIGIHYHAINTGKLRRYWDFKNFTDMFRVIDGFREAIFVLTKLKPDIVFSKGGFVSCPVVWAARLKRIPVVIHESDMTPGLTNKLSMPFAKKVCYTFPESGVHIPKDKGILTGIPIREEILQGNKKIGRKICGFTETKLVLMVIGGSQGSENINNIVRQSLTGLLKEFQVCHICGSGNKSDEYEGIQGYQQFEYINEEQPHIFAMADIVVSRAGATTLFEILALRKPNLLIPLSRNASRGDQILNAQSFKNQGFSGLLFEEQLTKDSFANSIMEVYCNKDKYISTMDAGNNNNAIKSVLGVIENI